MTDNKQQDERGEYINFLREFADSILEWRSASFAEQIQKYGGLTRDDAIKKFMSTHPESSPQPSAQQGKCKFPDCDCDDGQPWTGHESCGKKVESGRIPGAGRYIKKLEQQLSNANDKIAELEKESSGLMEAYNSKAKELYDAQTQIAALQYNNSINSQP